MAYYETHGQGYVFTIAIIIGYDRKQTMKDSSHAALAEPEGEEKDDDS